MKPTASLLAVLVLVAGVPCVVGRSKHSKPPGVSLPKGELQSAEDVRLMRDGAEIPAQFRATGLWRPDESIRWVLVDFQADVGANARQTYTLEYGNGISARAKPQAPVRVEESDEGYRVSPGAVLFSISKRVFNLFHEVRLADGTVVVSRPDAGQPRYGAVLRGLQPTVTRAIPGAANKGRSHLIYVACSPQAGLEDYTLRFTSPRGYELTDGKGSPVGRGDYLKDFSSTDGRVSIPGDAWLQYAWPAEGDVYTFRTIPEGHSAASEDVREATVLERGPLRSVIRLKGSLGPAAAPGRGMRRGCRPERAWTLSRPRRGLMQHTDSPYSGECVIKSCVFRDIPNSDPKIALREDGCDNSVGGKAARAACVEISIPFLGFGPDRETPAERPSGRPGYRTMDGTARRALRARRRAAMLSDSRRRRKTTEACSGSPCPHGGCTV